MIPEYIQNAKRIVIKIGSALLFDPVRGEARKDWMKACLLYTSDAADE